MNLSRGNRGLIFSVLLIAAGLTWKFTSIVGAASINGVVLTAAFRLWRYADPNPDSPRGLDDPNDHTTLDLRS
jgi:hypothetical protein